MLLAANLMVAPVTAGVTERAPDFTLKDLKGEPVSLSQLKGKVVFLDFWASWCPPCRRSIPEVEKLYDAFKGSSDVVVMGINIEGNPDVARKFAASKGLKYTILAGDQKTAGDYRVNGIPAFFIVSQDGKITRHYAGYQSGMETEWENVIIELLKSTSGKHPTQPIRK
jgi:thiol-disulfide isomerase/thioredoxin